VRSCSCQVLRILSIGALLDGSALPACSCQQLSHDQRKAMRDELEQRQQRRERAGWRPGEFINDYRFGSTDQSGRQHGRGGEVRPARLPVLPRLLTYTTLQACLTAARSLDEHIGALAFVHSAEWLRKFARIAEDEEL
jgi:hypothetical protein